MTYEVEVYQSLEGDYYAFLRGRALDIGGRDNLHIVRTYSLADLRQFSELVGICNESRGKPRKEN